MEDETLSSHVLSLFLVTINMHRVCLNDIQKILKEQALSRHVCRLLDGRQTIKAKIAFKC